MIITREQVKTYLGITNTAEDDAIDAILPVVDAKVKEITRRNWTLQLKATIDGTANAEIRTVGTDPFLDAYPATSRSVGVNWSVDSVHEHIHAGDSITGDGIPDDTYVTNVYSIRRTAGGRTYSAPSIELSNAATLWKDVDVVVGFNRAYFPIVAKLAWWMVNAQNQQLPSASVASESVGDISVSYSQVGAELDGRFGVPAWAIKGLPRYGRGF
jgi:hypothetical protein